MEHARIGHALLGRLGVDVEQLAKLVVVGLDHERLGLERLEQQRAGGVDDEADAATGQARHDDLVHVVRQALGDGAREHERVAGLDAVQAAEQLVDLVVGDLGAHAVDDRHHDAVELDVDAREALVQAHEVARDAGGLQRVEDVVTREAGDDAKADRVDVELVEDARDVDAVATATDLLARGAVREAHVERKRVHDVVDGGVKGNGVDQEIAPSTRNFPDSSMTQERPPTCMSGSRQSKKLTSIPWAYAAEPRKEASSRAPR